MSHNLLKPRFRGVTNNLLNTTPDLRASLKIMTWLLKIPGGQFASISLVLDLPRQPSVLTFTFCEILSY
jgi:hypothetical protein